MSFPQYYGEVREVKVENTPVENVVAIDASKTSTYIPKKKVNIGKIFANIGAGLLIGLQYIGKFFAKIGVGIWKGACAIAKVIAFPFVWLFKICAKKPIIAVVLGLIVVATPIICYFVLREPCCYTYGKVVARGHSPA